MNTQTYKVVKGDTLSKIAKRYGVGVGDISGYRSNNPNLIYPDEMLTIKLKDIQNTPSSPANKVEKPEEKAYNKVSANTAPNLDYIFSENNDYTYNKSDEKKIIKDTTKPQDRLAELSNQIDRLYGKTADKGQYQVDMNKQFHIPEQKQAVKDLERNLKLLQQQRQVIPMQLQENATGRGITDAGLNPISASELRKNAIQQFTLSSQIEAYNGNLQSSIALRDEAIKSKYAPIEYEIDSKIKQYNNVLDTYKNLDTTYAKTFKRIAELRKLETEKDKEKIALDKLREKIAYRAIANNAPVSVRQAIAEAKSLRELLEVVGIYGQNETTFRQRYYPKPKSTPKKTTTEETSNSNSWDVIYKQK